MANDAVTYIRFVELETPRKTKLWSVLSVSSGYPLGEVKWYAPWRCYCFFPNFDTIWNTNCLDDITAFIRARMAER